MQNGFKLIVSVIVCCLTLMLTATNMLQAQLVNNGSFENSDIGVYSAGRDIKGWYIEVAAGATPPPEFEIVSDTVKEGNRALKVTAHGLGANQWDIQVVVDSIPVTPGATYNYSIWAKSSKPSAQVNITMGNYAYSEYKAIRPAALTTQWQKFTMQFTVNDAQTFIRGPIHFNYAADTGNAIYIDNLQIVDANAGKKPIIVEAEAGTGGSNYSVMQSSGVTYISPATNNGNLTYPGDSSRIKTYQVTFADSGSYNLFARIRVGANNFNDDSFFYGHGFGIKDTASADDWYMVNGLASAGFSDAGAFVDGPGSLGSGVWKWINITKNVYNSKGDSFYVSMDSLTRVLQIAGREDGLDIDKLAFGKSYLYFTVVNLDSVQAGSTSSAPVDTNAIWNGPPLATGQSKFVGNVYSSAQTPNFQAYWNQVTPENDGKWGSVEGTRDVMNWGGLDAAYNFAKNNGFPFHFHVLIWGAQQPSWISGLAPAEQLEEIREWFQAVADRYPDIEYLEVVNEPLLGHNPPDGTGGRANYKEALGGNGTTGWDWVINAFKMAREIFPDSTRLMLNDFSIINSSTSAYLYLGIINLLKEDTLIDIIGEQGHAFTTTADANVMKANLDILASTGLPIQITELDIDGPTDQVQLQQYQRIFPTLYKHPAVEGITLWGWRPGLWRNDQGAYLIGQDGTERPALQWLREYLDTTDVTVSVNIAEGLPQSFKLYNNYPNPFNPETNIRYNISKTSQVTLKVYDILGRQVQTLVNGMQTPGQYTVNFNAQKLASGVYLYRLQADNFVETKKLMLLK